MSLSLMDWVMENSPYSGTARCVHLSLADVANPDHGFELWIAPDKIAKRSKCSPASLRRILNKMVVDGYLTVLEQSTGGRGKHNRYRFEKVADTKPAQDERVGNPRRMSAKPAQDERETRAITTSAPLVNVIELKENGNGAEAPVPDLAREVSQHVFANKKPKPAHGFPAVQGVARKLLAAGHTADAVEAAMMAAPTISIGACEMVLNRRTGGRRLPENAANASRVPRDEPTGRVEVKW